MSQGLDMITEMLDAQPPEDFVDNYRGRTTSALLSKLTTIPGIENALDKIRVPYCVASSGKLDKMRTTLGITKLLPRFEGKLYSVTEVKKGKPHPDVFLYAAQKQAVAPSSCVVIEDRPTGVRAGVAAGMTVYGYAALTRRCSWT